MTSDKPSPATGSSTISLADQAYQLLEEMIVTLTLPPGSMISEIALSNRLHIGRTPIREALQRLSQNHLVEVLPRRGMLITRIDLSQQLAMVETRRVLDHLIAGRAALRATDGQRVELRECAENMRRAAQAGDIALFMREDRCFDRIMESASRNPFAVQANAPLHAHCRRFWYYYQSSGDLTRAAHLHARLMLAVANGDEADAGRQSDILIDYMETFVRLALKI